MIFVMLLLLTLFAIWFERKVVGRMQHRPGPNWNGPFGLLQSLADALKLIFKEGMIPTRADKFVYIAAPIMSRDPGVPDLLDHPGRRRGHRCSVTRPRCS